MTLYKALGTLGEVERALARERANKAVLLGAIWNAVRSLDEAQGEWVFMEETFAPESVGVMRRIADALRAAIGKLADKEGA